MRARLVYQSRKRGILETDLLLSTFIDAGKLKGMTRSEMVEYDRVRDLSSWSKVVLIPSIPLLSSPFVRSSKATHPPGLDDLLLRDRQADPARRLRVAQLESPRCVI